MKVMVAADAYLWRRGVHKRATLLIYRVGQKTGLWLRSDNFATIDDRKACNASNVSEFCLE